VLLTQQLNKCFATVEELSALPVFVTCNAAAWITGIVLPVTEVGPHTEAEWPRHETRCARRTGNTQGPSMKEFLKTTIVGGLLFLLPVALVLVILGYAVRLAAKVVQPISNTFHLDRLGVVGGVGSVTVLAVLMLIIISFVAGILARTIVGRRITRWFEGSLLAGFPQYQLVKSMAEGLAQVESANGVRPALVSIEGGWQIGYLLELLGNGWVVVFLPQAPTPMSGNVMYFPADRVRPLSITMLQAMAIVKRIGVGSGEALHGIDLRLPIADH
jgi:uncharacterized membrane protein